MTNLLQDLSSSLLGARASRPHRAPKGAKILPGAQLQTFMFTLRAHCGRDARGPSEELEWSSVEFQEGEGT
jgi:hypothetical protein